MWRCGDVKMWESANLELGGFCGPALRVECERELPFRGEGHKQRREVDLKVEV